MILENKKTLNQLHELQDTLEKSKKITFKELYSKEYYIAKECENIINHNIRISMLRNAKIDLRKCKPGDRLLTLHGDIAEYVSPTPWISPEGINIYYLDHVIKYLYDKTGKKLPKYSYGTRTHEGHVFAKSRIPEQDNDIIQIYPKGKK